MAHNLFGDRYLGRKPAWHDLGSTFADRPTAKEAVVRAGLDYRVDKYPQFIDLGGVQIQSEQMAIVRDPTFDDDTYRVFGHCSDDYGIVQNIRIAELMDKLTEKWPVETAGALGLGETIFLTLDAGEQEIGGDPVRQFFLVTDTKTGDAGIKVAFTPVRVVCQNTLVVGLKESIVNTNLRHSGNVEEELEWRLDLVAALESAQDKVMATFELMAQTALESTADAKSIIASAYPYPRKPRKVQLAESVSEEEMAALGGLLDRVDQAEQRWVSAKERMDERRGAAFELFGKFNDENPHVARTPWAAYQAVVEVEDYREEHGNEDADASALFGYRARSKKRAYAAALEYAEDAPLAV